MEQENIKQEEGVNLSKNKKYIIIAIVVILAIGFLANGFMGKRTGEKMAENILENQFGGEVDLSGNGDSVSIKNDKGSFSAGDGTKWPLNMPSDIPEFTAGKLTMATSVSNEDGGWQVAVTDVVEKDFSTYHSLLKTKGWKDVGIYDANFGMIQMEKENYSLLLVFNSQEKTFVLTVSIKK